MAIERSSLREQLRDYWKVMFYVTLIALALAVSYFVRTSAAAQGMLIGAVSGLAVHWIISAKSSVCIENVFVPYARSWIENKGYISSAHDSELIPNAHRLLRFNSQNVHFERIDEARTRMFGPHYLLKQFEKRLT